MSNESDFALQLKKKGYTNEQIGSQVASLNQKDSDEQRKKYIQQHKKRFLFIFFLSFVAFFAVWYITQYGLKFGVQELLISFVISLIFSFFPVTNYYYLSIQSKTELLFQQKLHKNTTRILILYSVYFILFFLLFYVFKTGKYADMQIILLSLIALLGTLYYFSFVLFLARVFKDRKKFLFRLIITTLGMLAILFLVFDPLLFVIFLLTIIHWYVYTSKDLTVLNTTKNLMIFLTTFFITGFLVFIIRIFEIMIRTYFTLPEQNIYSYSILAIGLTFLFYTHLSTTKYLLKSYYSIIRETDYYGKLHSILSFDARYSNTERRLMRIILFIVIALFFIFILVIWFNIKNLFRLWS